MSSDHYDVVFDLAAAGFQVPWLLVFVGFAGGVAGALEAIRKGGTRGGAFSAAVAALFIAGASGNLAWLHADFERLREARVSGEPEIVEGRVLDFYLGSSGGNVPGRFEVGDQRFSADDTDMPGAAYNRWPRDFSGQCARVAFVQDERGNRIVWLGLQRPESVCQG